MSLYLLFTGIFIVIVTALDFFYTTLSFNGAGYINKTITATLSSSFLFLNERFSNRRILKFSGLSHILISISVWIALLWIGLFLILSSFDAAVIHTSSQAPASSVSIFYFSGYVLSTLGNGEFKPASENWQLVVVFFSFSGFIFITTGISYLLNLASAVIHKRTLALSISNLGGSPEEIVANTYYDNGSYGSLINRIPDLQEKINKHNQNHFAYPISHYFYSTSKTESLAINLSNLDEALTIILYYTEKKTSVEKEITIVRNAIYEFLDTIQHSFITKLEEHEDVSPSIQDLKNQGIPIIDEQTASQRSLLHKRRSLILGFLKSCGWSWKDIYNDDDE